MAMHSTCAGIACDNAPNGLPVNCRKLEVAPYANLMIWKGYDCVQKIPIDTYGYSR